MNRRTFLKQALIAGGVAAVAPFELLAARRQAVHLTILHTNDMHSRIEPFPLSAPQHAGEGGMARRATLIKQIRSQNPHVLLLDSGDIFQGTPYFNFFGGELEFKLMSEMGYDAATLGNHDFDNGLEGLLKMMPHAHFPFLIANYDFSRTPLHGKTKPYQVFERGGVRIGVFGIGIELQNLVNERLYGKTRYLDPVGVAHEMVKTLRKDEKCELIVCLSHLGFSYTDGKISDVLLASKVPGIDIILGGHTHTFMQEPYVMHHADGNHTIIHQVGWAGVRLGRIDLLIEEGKKRMLSARALPVHTARV
jgi:5'-nucleotidase